MFKDAMTRESFEFDFQYDWLLKRQARKALKTDLHEKDDDPYNSGTSPSKNRQSAVISAAATLINKLGQKN
jgi:hypothetical protein